MKKHKLIAIVGATATGKSGLGIELSKKYSGEVVSADSRQVFRGLDIGSGKVTKKEMDGVPHHMLDVVEPEEEYSVSLFKIDAENKIEEIVKRSNVPFIVGGTGQYVEAIVSGMEYPEVPPNEELRTELEKKDTEELFSILKKLDPKRAESIDPQNKRRLVRAIEIAKHLGSVPKIKKNPQYEVLQIGLELPDDELREKIEKRLHERIDEGMIEEVEKLIEDEVSKEWLKNLGLEYRYITEHLEGEFSKEEMIEILSAKIWQFSRRQMRWFKRDENIHWFHPTQAKEIDSLVADFLSSFGKTKSCHLTLL